MTPASPADASISRLQRLMGYLKKDPENPSLLLDAAEAALAEGEAAVAIDLLDRRRKTAPPGDQERNLEGLAAIALSDFDGARRIFTSLLEEKPDDPALRFNLAWSAWKSGAPTEALALLDESVTAALPQAALLEVEILHVAGDFDPAIDAARRHIQKFPDHLGLMSAVSVLAMDVEDRALARDCALKAGDHPEAMTTLGVLALGEGAAKDALDLFDAAINAEQRAARSWVGRGLAQLALGDYAAAAADIDRGAEIFGDHLGSYIAAGWAHLIKGDTIKAEERFQKALAIDPNFGETHGSLAAIDVIKGDIVGARSKTKVAIRLDKACFSARVAQSLILTAEGSGDAGRAVFDAMLHMPIDDAGRTIAQTLVSIGAAGR